MHDADIYCSHLKCKEMGGTISFVPPIEIAF
jgi:hypothetical protein